MEKEVPRPYGDTPFKRHISYFDYKNEGLIRPYQSLRAGLSIGLDFPAACVYAVGLQLMYGNVGFLGLRAINVNTLSPAKQRTQLQDVPVGKTIAGTAPQSYTRPGLMSLVRSRSFMDRMHVLGFWALAADRNGLVKASDVELFQKGELLPELARRRACGREDVIPLTRGGPISVRGHSWFVDKLFDIKVYQKSPG